MTRILRVSSISQYVYETPLIFQRLILFWVISPAVIGICNHSISCAQMVLSVIKNVWYGTDNEALELSLILASVL